MNNLSFYLNDMGIISVDKNDNSLLLREKLDSFFNQAEYIKQGPNFNELLQKKSYLSYIMMTGSSGAGKTTQVTTINDSPNSFESAVNQGRLYDKDVNYTIATRFITRKSRVSDNKTGFEENKYVDREKFQRLIDEGIISIYRERDLGSEKVLYGFLSNEAISGHATRVRREIYECVSGLDRPDEVRGPHHGGIIVYSGNNDMCRNLENIPFCEQNRDQFVHIHVQAEDNTERFIQRSQDVAMQDQLQLQKRASDDGLDVYEKSHVIVTNIAGQQESIKKEFSNLIGILADYNKKMASG